MVQSGANVSRLRSVRPSPPKSARKTLACSLNAVSERRNMMSYDSLGNNS